MSDERLDQVVAGGLSESLTWPVGDRDSPVLGEFSGGLALDGRLADFLAIEGHDGRSERAFRDQLGKDHSRPRRWHKIYERMGLLYPGDGNTRLAHLGRLIRDLGSPEGYRLLLAREVLQVLWRYQFNNPFEKSFPAEADIHPYYAVIRAAAELDWRLHWDEVNRELMWLTRDDQISQAIDRIRQARTDASYSSFIGGRSNEAGLLRKRAHNAEDGEGDRSPEGQLRDQKLTPFLKRAGFAELLLKPGRSGGGGYWTVPEDVRTVVAEALNHVPISRGFANKEDWIEWFCEGRISTVVAKSDQARLSPPPVVTPVRDLTLKALREALATWEPDLVFSDSLLASVVAALRAGDGKNFLILKGISGTGKSRLVSAIAKAIYGQTSVPSPWLTMIEVRPDWTDGSFLLGHHDPIGGRYVRERFLDALLAAASSGDEAGIGKAPVFVCLDEMNLARVEYYLADCLSGMESGGPIALDVRGDTDVPASIVWPANFYLFGTVNIDETTHRISDKVLDRAQVIDTSDIDLLPTLSRWLDAESALLDAERERVRSLVGGVWKALAPVDSQFGFRTAKAVVRFVAEAKASSDGVLSIDDAIDIQLMQKVLVKLRGEGDRWSGVLGDLELTLGDLSSGKSKSEKVVTRMREDLERLGSFQFWG